MVARKNGAWEGCYGSRVIVSSRELLECIKVVVLMPDE